MDILFVNGRINTLDKADRVYSAVGATSGIITDLGSDMDLLKHRRSQTEVVDLKGSVMFPGFMEAHCHLPIFGYLTEGLDLAPPNVRKLDDVLRLVKAETQKLSPGTWIKGSRYAEYFLAENRHPTRHDLDRVSPHHPVILYHISFHACVLNSPALEILGITGDTSNPKGGIIEKDSETGTWMPKFKVGENFEEKELVT